MEEELTGIDKLIGSEELVRLAVAEIDEEEPIYRPIEDAVRQLIADQAGPVKALSHAEINVLEDLIDDLRQSGDHAFGEAMLVSLRRIKLETGWTPESCPLAARLLSGSGELFLAARHAFGVIALAWQIQRHPTDTFLTAGRLLLSVN